MVSDAQLRKAQNLYRDWHEFEPENVITIDVPEPKGNLKDLGEILKLDYESDKWNQDETVYYYHYFKKNAPHLLKDSKGNFFINGNIKVTPLGIDDWDDPQIFKRPRGPGPAGTKLGILEEIKVIDPVTKKRIPIDFGDRYYLADPKGDWTFISSPIKIPITNPSRSTIRQEIHNLLRAHRLPLDSLDQDHPKYEEAIALLEEKGLAGRYIETGNEENPVLPSMLSLTYDNLLDATTVIIISSLATGILTFFIHKVLNEYWSASKKKKNPVWRCERPIDERIIEEIPFIKHTYFDVAGKKVGYQVDEDGSYLGEDRPIRERARKRHKCKRVDLDEQCVLDIIASGEQFGFESESYIDPYLYGACHKWADIVEDLCLIKENPVDVQPPWALDEWITPKEETAARAVDMAEKIGAANAYYELTDNGNYRIHLKWRIKENPGRPKAQFSTSNPNIPGMGR